MSRIHDALKKAESERALAAAAAKIHPEPASATSINHNGELPNLTSVPFTDLAADYQAGLHGADSPHVPRTVGSTKQGRTAELVDSGIGLPDRQALNMPVACEAALLEQCARFDLASAPRRMLSANRGKYRIGAEEFRTLRSNLELVRKQQLLRTLLVTSPLPAEGKTFIAVNLAYTLAWQRDQRVLLIDGDLRLPRVHKYFREMPQAPGLTDYLSGDVDLISSIRRGPGDNFFVLTAGRSVPNALEVIGNNRLKPMIQWLAPAFDWIVIDSPPSVPVSDARIIAECADGIVFVLQAGHTPSDLAQRSAEQIRGKRYLGIVLNAVETSATGSSYYYGDKGNGTSGKRPS